MAGLNSSPGMRSQFAAIARVRWQLWLNGLRTVSGRLELVARGLIFLGFSAAGFGGSFALGALSWLWITHDRLSWLAIPLWFVFLFWQLFPVMASALTESADSSSLLRFPLSFPSYFMVRLVFGALEPSTLMGSLWLLGMAVGIGIADSRYFLWAAAVLAVFAIFNILLARMIFAWVGRWLAQRRSREILGVVFFVFVIGFQFLGPLLAHLGGRGHSQASEYAAWILPIERFLPPGLAAESVTRALRGQFAPALATFALECLYGLAVLWLLNLRLRAEYLGENLSEGLARTAKRKEKQAVRLGWSFPSVSGAVAAILEKEFHYLSRSGPVLFSLVMPVVILLIFRVTPARSGNGIDLFSHASDWAFPIGAAYSLLILTNLVYNSFGAEAVGMQFYFVSPAPFRQVLLGKNLAYTLVLLLETILVWFAACFLYRPPSPEITLATFAALAFAMLANLTAGNLLSIYTPKKIDYGTLGKQRASTMTVLASLGVQGLAAGLIALTLLVARVYGKLWIAVAVFLVLSALTSIGYFAVLRRADRIALSRREEMLAELCRA
jgi:ABC-2 type transport system permease protein